MEHKNKYRLLEKFETIWHMYIHGYVCMYVCKCVYVYIHSIYIVYIVYIYISSFRGLNSTMSRYSNSL
jgi:hypothetical protein